MEEMLNRRIKASDKPSEEVFNEEDEIMNVTIQIVEDEKYIAQFISFIDKYS